MGYDYIEPGAVDAFAGQSPEADRVRENAAALQAAGIGAEACNGLVPADLRITGPNRVPAKLHEYMQRVCERAATLDVKALVFGSGGARRVDDGYPHEQAWSEIVAFLKDAAGPAAANGIVIAIEPLCAKECNIINSVAEGIRLAEAVGRRDAVAVLSDKYHVDTDAQSYEETASAGARLRHVHVACGLDRHAPRDGDVDELTAYFNALKLCGYDERVSVECSFVDFEAEAPIALDAVRRAWKAASPVGIFESRKGS
jgi:sugar phosphate isomerase/epimerase